MKRALPSSRLLIAAAVLVAAADTSVGAEIIEIRNVRIVDVRNGSISPPSLLRVVEGRIASIARVPAKSSRPSGEFIDGTGKFLVPGYWDMHVHVSSSELAAQWMFPLLVAHGITGVRDMKGDCWVPGCEDNAEGLRQAQARIRSGEIVGPRILAIGSDAVGGPRAAHQDLPEWASPRNAGQGRELVHIAKERGIDFIKTYDTIPRDAYFAMMAEAARVGIAAAGHVPKSVSMLEAVEAGQRSIEHAKHPVIDCSVFAPVFRRVFSRWAAGESEWIYSNWARDAAGKEYDLGGYHQHVVSSFDNDICQQVIGQFAASKAYYVPTLITRKFEAFADDPTFLDDARLRFVPKPVRKSWMRDSGNYKVRFGNAAAKYAYVSFYELGVRLTGEIHRAGTPILVGTDTPDSYCFPGSGYYDELQELRSAGLSNVDILRAATWDAARFMNMEDSFGSIEVGKAADLLILEGNPLADISNAGRITSIVLNGRLLDAETLARLKAQASDFAVNRR